MSDVIPLRPALSVTSEIIRMDAAMAEQLLTTNRHNRPLNERTVLQYAADMEEGRWQFNGEAIKIGADGLLLDGQHRLMALAMTKSTTLEFLIIRGLPAESQTTMDQGRKRSAADQLTLSGIDANKTIASAIRVLLTWERGHLFTEKAFDVTTTEIVEWAAANPAALQRLRRATAFSKIEMRPGVMYAVFARIAAIHRLEVAEEFFARAADGAGLDEGSPILVLRRRLTRVRREGFKLSDRDAIGYLVAAFNYWVTGAKVARLQQSKGGWNGTNFPDIVPSTVIASHRPAAGDR